MHYVNPAWRGSASAWAEKQQLDRGGGWSLSIPGANLGNTGSVLRLVWQPLFNFKVNSALIDDGYMRVCCCINQRRLCCFHHTVCRLTVPGSSCSLNPGNFLSFVA